MDIDYKKLGFRCGIEIHRQLASKKKLFCRCANEKSDSFPFKITRNLRAVAGELGKVDRAALHEMMKGKTFVYNYNPDTSCLVELDDEPPSNINKEALEIVLTISLMLNMKVVDEMHVMRKTVVDGSSVSGFQRTALLAYDGYIETSEGRVGIVNLSIEEDSAPKVLEEGESVHYRLDRLGVPLVEIGTDTDIVSPEHCREVAEKLGMILKSTGKVKRGIGTIRQDVNVSIRDGARVEVKGAQDLRMIPELVRLEVERQKSLVDLRDELASLKLGGHKCDMADVTDIFSKSQSKIVRGKSVYGMKIAGFSGFFKKKLHAHRTLGNEVANYARVKAHVKGIIHTDEDIDNYGLVTEFEKLESRLKAGRDDMLVIVAADKDTARRALEAVCDRVNGLASGVPEETRRALPNADSEYMRPLPGASRMYPETDVRYVAIPRDMIAGIKMPETMDEKQERFQKVLGLNKELAMQIVNSEYLELFEKSVLLGAEPKLACNVFVNVLSDLKTRENVDVGSIRDDVFFEIFGLVREGKITKDVIPVILRYIAGSEYSVLEVVESKGLGLMSEDEARDVIKGIIKKVRKEKGAQMKQIIGKCMGALRGKIDNKRIVEIIKDEMGE
ncbi:MAG: Glu-tRNA(Gln) amidotransferase subunit GatE [archaeon]